MTRFSPGPSGYWTQALYTSINALLYVLSFGRYLFLEGRNSRGTWHNWTHGEEQPAVDRSAPTTEDEIVERILNSRQLRVVGAGHSFNTGVRGEATLSLDGYAGIIENFDHTGLVESEPGTTLVRVRAGTRVRELNRRLRRRGLAIVALPSHDAQSVAGILSTDVHGTGRDVGFVSASVVGLRVIDGRGRAHDVWSDDPLFRAAIGGIGAVGVITEVSLRCVDAFRLRQQTTHIQLDRARQDWRRLLDEHDHASFYLFPFAKYAQLHTWDRTEARRSFAAGFREFMTITMAALSAAWIGDLISWGKLLPRLANLTLRSQRNSKLVMESAEGFNRTIYHMHQELEFTVPIERTWEVSDHLLELYESHYRRTRMPFTLIELRFTPASGTRSLIGPGAGDQRHVYVNLVCNQSGGFAEYYEAAEAYMREIDARPHLGKWCETYTHVEGARQYGSAFEEFTRLRNEHDPDGRFRNAFSDRVLGPIGATTDPSLPPSGEC